MTSTFGVFMVGLLLTVIGVAGMFLTKGGFRRLFATLATFGLFGLGVVGAYRGQFCQSMAHWIGAAVCLAFAKKRAPEESDV